MIYFVQCNKYIKIGTSNNAVRRLWDLQNGSPYPLKLLKTIPGGYADEQKLHKRFAKIRKANEWFYADKKLMNFIGRC